MMQARRTSVLVISHVSVCWGAQRRILDLAPRLRELGVDLHLAAPPGDLIDEWRDLGLGARELVLPEHRGIRDAGQRPGPAGVAREAAVVARSTRRLVPLIRQHDLVQSHSLWAHMETALAGRVARRPVVLDVHDIVAPGLGRRLLHVAATLATITIANSTATAEMVGGAGRDGVVVINPGVDLDRFRPGPPDAKVRASLSNHPDAPLVGILGRVDPRKGIDVVIEAMAKARGPAAGACLAIVGHPFVGDDRWMASLTARAGELLGDRVRFVGPRGDPERVMRAIDVLVNASHHEPFGRTVLEAQASGTPVVGTDSGGIPEFVTHGETGLLVPPQDAASLATALEQILGSTGLAEHLAEEGRSQAAASFGVDGQAEKVASAYERARAGQARWAQRRSAHR